MVVDQRTDDDPEGSSPLLEGSRIRRRRPGQQQPVSDSSRQEIQQSTLRQTEDPYPHLRRQLNLPPIRVPASGRNGSVVTDENDPSPTNRSPTSSELIVFDDRRGLSNGILDRRTNGLTGGRIEERENHGEPVTSASDDTARQRRPGDTVRPVVLTPNRRQINNGQMPANGDPRTVVTVQGAGTTRRNALANVLHGLSTAQIVRIISSRENLQQQEDDPFKSKHC